MNDDKNNAVVVSQHILQQLKTLKKHLIPADINIEVTRNYGQTANDKANELLFHLGLATLSIVSLIGFSIGWREAGVTFVIIPATILLTLFAANLMGYTINRVSLFALIFSIGILVDDAIVVIENISRHWTMDALGWRLRSPPCQRSEIRRSLQHSRSSWHCCRCYSFQA
jgi:multidrug efflux pump subunit AcrB